jgi:hypothetical protein
MDELNELLDEILADEALLATLGLMSAAVFFLFRRLKRWRRGEETPWDKDRVATLDLYSKFSIALSGLLRCASKEAASDRVHEASLIYGQLVLYGSSSAVLAADRARNAGAAYMHSLPDTDAEATDGDGDGVAYTTGGTRRVMLSQESTELQLAAVAALYDVIAAARKQVGIKPLRAGSMGRPL